MKGATGVDAATHDEKLVSPAVQRFERVRRGHVVDKDATIRSPIECHAQALKAFLTSRVPDLATARGSRWCNADEPYLHGDEPIIDLHFFREKVSADRRLVLIGESIGDELTHQTCLANTTITCG